MSAIFFDLSEQFLANGHRFKYYGIVRTVMEVGYELAQLGDVRFVVYSPAHGRFFEVTPRFDAASPTGVMDPGLPPEATPIRLRQSFPTRNILRDGLLRLIRPIVRQINLRRWRHVPEGVAREVDMRDQILIALGRPKIIADYLVNMERIGTMPRMVPLLHDMIPLHAFRHREQKMFTSNFMHDNRQVIRHSDLVLTNSEFTRDEVAHFGEKGHFPGLPDVVPVPLAHELRTTQEPVAQVVPEGSYLLCVGTYPGRKNLECVMDALLTLSQQGRAVPDLVLAGARRKRTDDFIAQPEYAPLKGKVHFVFDPNQSELRALYDRALALILPSYMEGWGLPLGEALWTGTPGLASTAPALKEVGGGLARYFDPADPAALAALIDEMQSDTEGTRSLRSEIVAARPGLRSWRMVASEVLQAVRGKLTAKVSQAGAGA